MKKIEQIKDWKEMIGAVMHADCLDVMQKMPDNCVDLVLTDPPYGIGFDNYERGKSSLKTRKRYTKNGQKNWDAEIPLTECFREIFRISKNQIIWGANYFWGDMFPNTQCFIFWNKKQPLKNFAAGELAWTSFKRPASYFEHAYYGNVNNEPNGRQHPTQKPLELGRWCLENYTKKEEREKMIVFDPFGGSFTFARACQDMGIKFISCDMEKEYCEIGENRLKQQNLF